MLLEILMQCSCIISHKVPPLERRFRDIQIVIITNFVVVSSVGIKRVYCSSFDAAEKYYRPVLFFFSLPILCKYMAINNRGRDEAFYNCTFIAECEGRRAGVMELRYHGQKNLW